MSTATDRSLSFNSQALMRSCLPQGNLSVEEEFEIFGEEDEYM